MKALLVIFSLLFCFHVFAEEGETSLPVAPFRYDDKDELPRSGFFSETGVDPKIPGIDDKRAPASGGSAVGKSNSLKKQKDPKVKNNIRNQKLTNKKIISKNKPTKKPVAKKTTAKNKTATKAKKPTRLPAKSRK